LNVSLADVKGEEMTIMWALKELLINTNDSMITPPSTEIFCIFWLMISLLEQNQYSNTKLPKQVL